MLLRGLLVILSLGEVYCTYVTINGTVKKIYVDKEVNFEPHSTTTLDCYVDTDDYYPEVTPVWTVVGGSATSGSESKTRPKGRIKVAEYTFVAQGTATVVLRCGCESSVPPCHSPVTITLKATPSSTTTHQTSPTTSTTSTTQGRTDPTPSTQHSGSNSNQGTSTTNQGTSTTKKPNKFKGVNPLIYTVIAVFLLGTLAVVAIVTCWIRARKTFYRRNRLPQFTTPRDYFEGISDSDFTPLTANQFYASLRDAPPTYHESEVIQANLRDDQGNNSSNDQTPPPLPPRDHTSSSRRNGSPSGHGDSAQQNENSALLPARQLDDEALLISSAPMPTGSSSLPGDSLLL